MKKTALFAFNEDPMCFIHVLLNAIDFNARGYEVKIIFEGGSCKLIDPLSQKGNPLNQLYTEVKDKGLIEGVCRGCAAKLGATAAAEKEGLTFLDDIKGHPSMARYREEGFEIITF